MNRDGTRHKGRLSREEYRGLFEYIASGRPFDRKDWKSVEKEVLIGRDRTTVRRAMEVARILNDRQSPSLTTKEAEDISRETKYDATASYVQNMSREYNAWRDSQAQLVEQGERPRLEEITSSMWVPRPDEIPFDEFKYGSGINVEVINGREFRWEYGDGDDKHLVWIRRGLNSWFVEKFLPSLGEELGGELAESWRCLQAKAIRYVNKALQYKYQRISGGGYEYSVEDIERGRISGMGFNNNHPMVQDASELVDAARELNRLVERFKDRVNDAVSGTEL